MHPDASPRKTHVARLVRAPRSVVYRALVDPAMVREWLPPGTMRGDVHVFEPREGGRIRMTLTYADTAEGPGGKTTPDADTFEGRFEDVVPDVRVVWLVTFESDQPGMSGEMRVAFELADVAGGTEVAVRCDGIPPGIRLEDNEAGSNSSLEKLARLMEG